MVLTGRVGRKLKLLFLSQGIWWNTFTVKWARDISLLVWICHLNLCGTVIPQQWHNFLTFQFNTNPLLSGNNSGKDALRIQDWRRLRTTVLIPCQCLYRSLKSKVPFYLDFTERCSGSQETESPVCKVIISIISSARPITGTSYGNFLPRFPQGSNPCDFCLFSRWTSHRSITQSSRHIYNAP